MKELSILLLATIRGAIFAICILLFAISLSHGTDFSGNYQGSWFSYRGPDGGVSASVSQSGSNISGTLSVMATACGNYYNVPFSGSVNGSTATFTASSTCNGLPVQFAFTNGTLYGNSMNGNYTIYAGGAWYDSGTFIVTRPTAPMELLTVMRTGSGLGTVIGSGINCGSTCSASYTGGSQVTLTATPGFCSTFVGWTGCPSPNGTTCTVYMDGAQTVSANFGIYTGIYQLTVQKSGTGSGTVTGPSISCGSTCSASYTCGTQVTLSAPPALGSTFTGWGGCQTVNGTTCVVTMDSAKTATANYSPTTNSGSFVYGGFGSGGIWMYNGTAWGQLTPSNPQGLAASGVILYGNFGSGGIWLYDGTAGWTQITKSNPDMMVVSGSTLYGHFGTDGIWLYNGSTWTQITKSNPDMMVVSGSTLYGHFSTDGIWLYNGSTWTQITRSNPDSMVASGSTLYGHFSTDGIWLYNGSGWNQITQSNPENMVVSGSLLYGHFGTDGIWVYNGSTWTQITRSNPENMVAP